VGSELLYLDTARLGRMAPGATAAQRDFATLAAEEGGSPAFERFLARGAASWPDGDRVRFPGLTGWGGVAALKASLRRLAGSRPDLPVLLANRSAQLMKLAGRLLCHPCEHILGTDLGWPGYHDILEAECRRAGRSFTAVPVRDRLLGVAAARTRWSNSSAANTCAAGATGCS